MTNRVPAEVFPPGEFLRDELEARGWSQTEFAEIIGRPVKVVSEILAGKTAVTPKTATEIAAALDSSAQYWLNLETSYQLSKVGPVPERIQREATLRTRFPVKEIVKRGWISASENYDVLEIRVFQFFGVSAVNDDIVFGHAARRKGTELSALQLAWLLRVKQLGHALHTPKYSQSGLRSALAQLELLMTEPEEVRHVPKVLAECGVRLVVVEPVPGSKIEGVCFWTDGGKTPVVGLSMKTDRIDNFWFNLRHELEHVLRGDGREAPMIDEAPYSTSGTMASEAERMANDAAADFCVPQSRLIDFMNRHDPIYPENAVIGFSRIIKRHPGIVVGQLHHKTGVWNTFTKHQVKVRNLFVQSALTDGYGQTCSLAL